LIKKDYYDVLQVPRNADEKQIKKAYRELAIKFHPDRNPDDQEAEERFKEASEAYEVLSDPEKRGVYDQFGHDGLRGSGFQGFTNFDDIFSSFGSIFEDIFGFGGGARRSRNASRRGSDLLYPMEISFEDAAFGMETTISVEKTAGCLNCKGTGARPGTEPAICPLCRGKGQIRRTQGFFSISTTCHQCGGEGRIITDPCPECHGSGKARETHRVKVKVPAGIEDQMRLRLSGQGEAGERGGPQGDLYVQVHIKPHKLFQRDGNDVISQVEVGMAQASLGTKIEIPTLEGPHPLSIPKGMQSGKVLKISGRGIPNVRGYGRGDHLVQVIVKTPTRLSKRQEELLREFADLDDEKVNEKGEGLFERLKNLAQ